jgi:hypothetical protein
MAAYHRRPRQVTPEEPPQPPTTANAPPPQQEPPDAPGADQWEIDDRDEKEIAIPTARQGEPDVVTRRSTKKDD